MNFTTCGYCRQILNDPTTIDAHFREHQSSLESRLAVAEARLAVAVKTIKQLRPYGNYPDPHDLERMRQIIADSGLAEIESIGVAALDPKEGNE